MCIYSLLQWDCSCCSLALAESLWIYIVVCMAIYGCCLSCICSHDINWYSSYAESATKISKNYTSDILFFNLENEVSYFLTIIFSPFANVADPESYLIRILWPLFRLWLNRCKKAVRNFRQKSVFQISGLIWIRTMRIQNTALLWKDLACFMSKKIEY